MFSLLQIDALTPPFYSSTILVGFTLACVLTIIMTLTCKQKSKESPPLAPPGILATCKEMGTRAPFFLKDMVKATGSDIFRLNLPILGGAYGVGDPAAMRAILTDKTTDKARDLYVSFDFVSGGQNILTRTNTRKWKAARKCLSYSFSSSEVNRMNRICTDHVNQWIQNTLEPCIKNNETFDPSVEMTRLTLNVILEAAFEYTQLTEEEYLNLMHHLEVGLIEFAGKHQGNPLRKYYGPLLSEFRNAKKSCIEVRKFSTKILDTYRKNQNKSTNKTIVRMIVESDAYENDNERLAEITAMLIGGHETSGFTLGSTLILLAKHPEVSNKLRSELLSTDVSKRSSRAGYLHNVIRESKRMVPVAALGSIRRTGRDFSFNTSNRSMVIPKGATVFLPVILPHHHKQSFGDPESFRPERWDKEDTKMREAFMSFSLGNRDCVGQSLAVAELYSIIPRLIAEYDFEVEAEGKLEFFLTLKYVGARLKPTRVGTQ